MNLYNVLVICDWLSANTEHAGQQIPTQSLQKQLLMSKKGKERATPGRDHNWEPLG